MKKLLILLAVLGIMIPFSSFAAVSKIGYVDILGIFNDYKKTQDYDENLEQIAKKKGETLDEKKQKIEEMQDKLSLLKEGKQTEKKEEINKAIEEYKELERKIFLELKQDKETKMKEIVEDMNSVINDYAKKNKFDLIVNKNSVLYGQDNLDITAVILDLMNKKYKK